MAYELRERKNKGVSLSYYDTSDEDEDDHDHDHDQSNDPDYIQTRTSTRNRQQQEQQSINPRKRRRCPRITYQRPRQNRKLSHGSSTKAMANSFPSSSRQVFESDRTLLSWLIKEGEIMENERVKCEGKVGIVRGEGVECECCSRVMNVVLFGVHAGILVKRAYENIIVIRTNKSLIKHLMNVWKNKEKRGSSRRYNVVLPKPNASDGNDDTCQICGDGGDLICCDDCPSTFHLSCTELQRMPEAEKWYCPYCKCIYCGEGCSYRKLKCTQCDKSYHWHCYGKRETIDLNKNDVGLYCGSTCRKVSDTIQSMTGALNSIKEDYTWSLIRRINANDDHDEYTKTVCNTKVAMAFELLNESFKTNIDGHTQIDILDSVVYSRGSNLTRMNFTGFYIVILEKNGSMISAATIRMHGNDLADMPYIATRENCRFKGMSRMLFNAIEHVFSVIGIKHLVIPSIQEVANMWQVKYGFFPVNDEMKKKLMNYNTLNFPGTIRLQKNLGTSEDNENCTKLPFLDLTLGRDPMRPIEISDD